MCPGRTLNKSTKLLSGVTCGLGRSQMDMFGQASAAVREELAVILARDYFGSMTLILFLTQSAVM
jgi:hypothetical protein